MWPQQTLQMFQMKIKYPSNYWSDRPQILKLGLETLQIFQMKKTSNGRLPEMEDYLKYQKWNISATTGQIFLKS
jgi:hypothetical protein